jgi:5-methylcytosine-specific restriction enzyme subunit McrC
VNLTLTERRAVVRKLPRAVAAELAGRLPHAVEVVPTFARRRYRLTARGYVGWVRLGDVTVTFRPKRPWAEVRALFQVNPGGHAGGEKRTTPGMTAGVHQESGLLALLAHRLATLMLARSAAGLLRGYVERELTDSRLRGRIDLHRQLQKSIQQPTLFDQIADEWTPDIPWNRLPKAAALRLLAEPGLGGPEREVLERAVAAFAEVGDTPVSAAERAGMAFDARTEPYRELIGWCDLIGTDDVLVSLERAFEGYATSLFREALGEAVRQQQTIQLVGAPLVGAHSSRGHPPGVPPQLTPDLTVFGGSTPTSVWDAKWKRPDPTAPDVHQALAYAAALGVRTCGLVYPGRRWRVATLRAASGVALHLLRLPLTDDPVRRGRVVRRVREVCVNIG